VEARPKGKAQVDHYALQNIRAIPLDSRVTIKGLTILAALLCLTIL
jgi:hypothetical protein